MAERLRVPVKQHLAPRDDAAPLARVRGRVDAALDRPRARRARAAALVLAAAILLALGFALGRASAPVAVGPAPSAAPASSGAAPAASFAAAFGAMTTDDGTSSQTLGDGSLVELAPRSALRVREARADRVSLALDRGEARFVVSKRPERAFRVEAGNVTATVRGTAFRVTRAGDGAIVVVDEGRVEVEGPTGARTLEAGERFAPEAPEAPATDASSPTPTPRAPAWRPLAAKGDYPAAYAALGDGGVGREAAAATDAETLLSLADVARLSGHPKEAAPPLRRVLAEHRADPRASLAAFTLGKIDLESLGDPADAARMFEESTRLGAPPSIAEDASARRVEAYARAHEPGKARAAAAEYRAKFPGGRYDAEVTRWASGAP